MRTITMRMVMMIRKMEEDGGRRMMDDYENDDDDDDDNDDDDDADGDDEDIAAPLKIYTHLSFLSIGIDFEHRRNNSEMYDLEILDHGSILANVVAKRPFKKDCNAISTPVLYKPRLFSVGGIDVAIVSEIVLEPEEIFLTSVRINYGHTTRLGPKT
ncbi:hypothetical protein PoB_000107500 [Plakobranchus ocellatus]|uniref:Uncharacterized protein n=1 Tax=Plakobranchus ocellatus TaxID=259542 RepID=A0AAV3XUS4_9GAST|nr:hypothetical protein PoB_000107500 [Plakobranchus ocellatus]